MRVWEQWQLKGTLIYEGEIVNDRRIELQPSGSDAGMVLVRDWPGPADGVADVGLSNTGTRVNGGR